MLGVRRLLLALALLLVAGPAEAQIDSELVRQGIKAHDELDYSRAVELFRRALGESLTRPEKIVTYKTLGFAFVALGDHEPARRAFEELLRVEPAFELDRTISPRVRAVFGEARARMPAPGPTRVEVVPAIQPGHPRAGDGLRFRFAVPRETALCRLFYRRRGDLAFHQVQGEAREGAVELHVPGVQVAAPAVEYYFVGLDAGNSAVAVAHSIFAPGFLGVQERQVQRSRTWVWGLVGGLVGAAAVGGVLAGVLVAQANATGEVTIVPR